MPKRENTHSLKEYKEWLEMHARIPGHKHLFFFRDHYMRYFSPPKGARILDVGGFVGATAIHYAKLGHKVTSLEGAKTFATEFRKNVKAKCSPAEVKRIRLVNKLIEEFDELEAYDAACMGEILQFMIEPAASLRVLFRALAPGGRAFVAVPQRRGRTARHNINGEELLAMMKGAGFTAKVGQWNGEGGVPQWMGYGFKGEWQPWEGALV